MLLQTLYQSFIELSNNVFISKMLEKFARSKVSSRIIKSYAKFYHINQDEMEFNLNDYPTLEQLFIRKLKPGMRPIHDGLDSVISPVDGVIVEIGTVSEEKEIMVKGKKYSVHEMFGEQTSLDKYMGGHFIIFYLSPSHYHRIHSPVSGKIVKKWELGTKSYPVNRIGLKYGKSPLSKNYRKITEIATKNSCVTVAKIGAMYINSIHMSFNQDVIHKGDELAYFSFGSTVILFFEKDAFHLSTRISVPKEIKVGQKIGKLKTF